MAASVRRCATRMPVPSAREGFPFGPPQPLDQPGRFRLARSASDRSGSDPTGSDRPEFIDIDLSTPEAVRIAYWIIPTQVSTSINLARVQQQHDWLNSIFAGTHQPDTFASLLTDRYPHTTWAGTTPPRIAFVPTTLTAADVITLPTVRQNAFSPDEFDLMRAAITAAGHTLADDRLHVFITDLVDPTLDANTTIAGVSDGGPSRFVAVSSNQILPQNFTLPHEIGHAFGLRHAFAQHEEDGSPYTSCSDPGFLAFFSRWWPAVGSTPALPLQLLPNYLVDPSRIHLGDLGDNAGRITHGSNADADSAHITLAACLANGSVSNAPGRYEWFANIMDYSDYCVDFAAISKVQMRATLADPDSGLAAIRTSADPTALPASSSDTFPTALPASSSATFPTALPASSSATFPTWAIALVAALGGLLVLWALFRFFRRAPTRKDHPAHPISSLASLSAL